MASTSSSFVLSHLLATVTSSIPAIGDFAPRKQADMNQLMKHELLVGSDGILVGGKRVLWEEGIQGLTSSILDVLIPQSSLRIQEINDIRYVKKKDSFILHGSSVLINPRGVTHPKWRLTLPFSGQLQKMKRNQQESQTDTEAEEEAHDDEDGDEDGVEDKDGEDKDEDEDEDEVNRYYD